MVVLPPCLSRLSNGIGLKFAQDSLSEWLRRQTRNLLGSARASSNPAAVAFLLLFSFPFVSFFLIASLFIFLYHITPLSISSLLLTSHPISNKHPVKELSLLVLHVLLAHHHRLLDLHSLASRLDHLDLLHDRRALLLQHAQRLAITPHSLSHLGKQHRRGNTARRFHREDEVVPDHVQLHKLAVLGQADALSAHATPHSRSRVSRAIQIASHLQRRLASQVLDVEHAHGAGVAETLRIGAGHGTREGDLRSHSVRGGAHGRPLRVGLADALGGVALAVHALGVSGRSHAHLSRSQLDQNDVVVNQTDRAVGQLHLLAQRLHLQTLRVHRQVLHLLVVCHLLQRGEAGTLHLQIELDGVLVREVRPAATVLARGRKLLEVVGVSLDGNEAEAVAQNFVLFLNITSTVLPASRTCCRS